MDSPVQKVAGEAFNVGSNEQNYQIHQLANMVRDVLPSTTIEVVPDDPDKRSYHVRFDKIQRELGYAVQISPYEGIVEIKGISRDVGERTKIAVYSKDEKVDCVGACVGMRGSRVKNIVSELQGEKIDIVRFSSDIKEYIQAALSPAEISQIQLDFDEKKAISL